MVSRAEIHWDAIVTAVRSGMPVARALKAVPDAPSHPSFCSYLNRNPDRKAEIDAIRPARATPAQDVIAARFDEVLRQIEAGANSEEAGRACGFHHQSLHRYLRNNPDQRDRYIAAERNREAGKNRRGTRTGARRKRWTPKQFDDALDFIRDHRGMDLQGALRNQNNLPSLESLIFRMHRNPAYAARYAKAMNAHAAANIYLYIRAYGDEPSLLLSALMQNPLYAAAWERFKRLDERDDFISEAILAVLEGELSADDVAKPDNAKKIMRRVSRDRFESLDVPAFEGRDGAVRDTLGDTISNPSPIIFW